METEHVFVVVERHWEDDIIRFVSHDETRSRDEMKALIAEAPRTEETLVAFRIERWPLDVRGNGDVIERWSRDED